MTPYPPMPLPRSPKDSSLTLLSLFFIWGGLFIGTPRAQALTTETGLSYNYKKTVLDQMNYLEQQSLTGSLSLYIWERIALEFSYTNSLLVKKEKEEASLTSDSQRITTQYADVYEMDLIFVLADRRAAFQPYIKGGIASIQKRQVTSVDAIHLQEIKQSGSAPGGGVGLKYMVTESVGVKISYDILKTPTGEKTYMDDLVGRVGLSWVL